MAYLLVFILALLIRFLYFPDNIYFAYDQARDAFNSQEIIKGNLKIIGPPSAASEKLFAGVLSYYIYTPVFWLSGNNPEALAAFFRLYNSLGVILVFYIGKILFNKWTGILAALFFAISFEESQYSLFLSHQALAAVSVLIYYLGLTLLFLKKNQRGLILTALGLGLSIQFHYVHTLLIPGLIVFLVIFRKKYQISLKYILYAVGLFLLTVSTYILAELKFNFRFLSTVSSGDNFKFYTEAAGYALSRFLHDNFLANYQFILPTAILLIGFFIYLYLNDQKDKVIFLLIWFLSGILPYGLSGTNSYYYSASASISLLILTSYIVYLLLNKNKFFGYLLIVAILFNNLYLIINLNPKGVNREFIIQPGMLISDEKRALDYIYEKASGQPFAVNALTVPLNVNTTWSYLFQWYGQDKYHYLPVWGGEVAAGFPGNLDIKTERSSLPDKRFTIIEPTVGIGDSQIKQFFNNENYFSKVLEEKRFGTITVQKRERI